jgi:predicted O-methyltransferase YrrM
MHLLSYRDADAHGPVQRPEALLLNAVVQVIAPKVVIEFGFFAGHSAFNFLQALDSDAKLYSYDIADTAAETAAVAFRRFRNFKFLHKSQAMFCPDDIDHQKIDLVFFDAVHDFELNKKTWALIQPSLAERCLIIVHDTGTWQRADALRVYPASALNKERWLDDNEFEHQPGERQFVNWIREEQPEYSSVHFHSLNTLRQGLTVLQRSGPLRTRGWVGAGS